MGWFQANMLYEKATKLPPFSTPTGIMFLLVFKMRQSIEFQKSRALVQALMSQQGANDEHIKKAFDDMKEAFFPFDRNQKKAELKKMRDVMNHWIGQGPVVLEAQPTPLEERRKALRHAKGQKDLSKRNAQEREGRLTGLDAFTQAKRRTRGA